MCSPLLISRVRPTDDNLSDNPVRLLYMGVDHWNANGWLAGVNIKNSNPSLWGLVYIHVHAPNGDACCKKYRQVFHYLKPNVSPHRTLEVARSADFSGTCAGGLLASS
jgi:hypothetical protein